MTRRLLNSEGSVLDYSESDVVEATLVGFDINSQRLHLAHRIWLDENIVPILNEGGGVAIVGHASRSGSAIHNLKLSIARAKAVAAHLRQKVVNGGTIAVSGSPINANTAGLGESAAADAGVKDGTEDRYSRAVQIRAWRKAVPPAPPTPRKLPPAPHREVVVFRRWTKESYNMPHEPGSTGAELGEIVRDAFKPNYGETRKAFVPGDYTINTIADEYTTDRRAMMNGSETSYVREIRYIWGPWQDKVLLLKRTRHLPHGDRWKMLVRDHFERDKVWKETIGPYELSTGV